MQKFIVVQCFFALSLLASCVHAPMVATIEDAGGQKEIKTIAFVTPSIPANPILISIAPITVVGSMGGIVGWGYDHSVQEKHQANFDALLAANNFQPSQVLISGIVQKLQTKGYSVAQVPADRPTADFMTSYPAATTAHYDAYLDVVLVSIGYIATTISSPYQPVVFMKYRLVRATDNHVLEQGAFQYSSSRGDVHPDPKFDYQHYSQFSKDPSIAIAGLSEGLNEGSSAISNGLN